MAEQTLIELINCLLEWIESLNQDSIKLKAQNEQQILENERLNKRVKELESIHNQQFQPHHQPQIQQQQQTSTIYNQSIVNHHPHNLPQIDHFYQEPIPNHNQPPGPPHFQPTILDQPDHHHHLPHYQPVINQPVVINHQASSSDQHQHALLASDNQYIQQPHNSQQVQYYDYEPILQPSYSAQHP